MILNQCRYFGIKPKTPKSNSKYALHNLCGIQHFYSQSVIDHVLYCFKLRVVGRCEKWGRGNSDMEGITCPRPALVGIGLIVYEISSMTWLSDSRSILQYGKNIEILDIETNQSLFSHEAPKMHWK